MCHATETELLLNAALVDYISISCEIKGLHGTKNDGDTAYLLARYSTRRLVPQSFLFGSVLFLGGLKEGGSVRSVATK